MCLTCGCGNNDEVRVLTLDAHDHSHHDHHHHGHEHHDHEHHDHDHSHQLADAIQGPTPSTENLIIGEAILAKNDHLAQHNREWFTERSITALNLMSSPGSGKTSLLERTIAEFGDARPVCVIEGDQETTFDSERIRRAGARAIQVNTGAGCHLDAPMVQSAVQALDPKPGSWLFIENVGNLVCPALFDVGEHAKVVIISVTEGQDKPLKYPHMFAVADLVIVNKTDLLPYVDFDIEEFSGYARSLNRTAEIMPLSVKSGDGLDAWYAWLRSAVPTVT
ncbi:MAG TPA: hydrogenase nickel incorporation protein HypB [Propionibacteriaceae bacterium]|jgi:hydrogenase nickel incorporation protein HypB|nr:hydrogenase nickel incorporation protein HypB [Propionibacteriaceae bacterium]